MNDALAKLLLIERTKALKELEDIDELLRSRCNWSQEKIDASGNPVPIKISNPTPPAEKSPSVPEPATPPSPSTPPTPIEAKNDVPTIYYADEAREFLSQWESGGTFKMADFRKFVADKHGDDAVNEQSLRGPLPKMEKRGKIEIVQKGLGRNPVIYRKPFSAQNARLTTIS